MRMSKSFVPTLKEVPADAIVASHRLLVRAGFIRQLAAGIYSILPLAQRSLLKITGIIREEMDAIGGEEFYPPPPNPPAMWAEGGPAAVMSGKIVPRPAGKSADPRPGLAH